MTTWARTKQWGPETIFTRYVLCSVFTNSLRDYCDLECRDSGSCIILMYLCIVFLFEKLDHTLNKAEYTFNCRPSLDCPSLPFLLQVHQKAAIS